jgi:hypothetical protein
MSSASRTRSNRAVIGLMFIISRFVHASPIFTFAGEEPDEPVGSTQFWWKIIVSMGLVLLGGAFAGYVISLFCDI